MSFVEMYLYCVLGVVISVILPILRQFLPKTRQVRGGKNQILQYLWGVAKPYLVLGVFSCVVSLLLLAFAGDAIKDWRAALLIGYAWDSTLQKFKG